ncbi:hypothetical protein MPSEU_000640400 [Mayamaea pseudoterrestris]|nr:hypothetical protein MPSEU_000640400 [Mayamaea pseudoterrestris]
MIPHPPIFLSDIRVTDIYVLLAIGFLWELLVRSIRLLACLRKPHWLLQQEAQLSLLKQIVTQHQNMGPSAFVETSKLERKLLQSERNLAQVYLRRAQKQKKIEKLLQRYGNWFNAGLVFIAYYGVPVLTLEGLDSVLSNDGSDVMYSLGQDYVDGGAYLKALLFPISYIGFGLKLSKWGMPASHAPASVGALAVMWSAQVTCSHLMDAVDAYFAT